MTERDTIGINDVIAAMNETPVSIPIIGITGGKGGVGKSTVAVNLAEAFVQKGYKVSLVDADVDAPDDHLLLNIPLKNSEDVVITQPLFIDDKCTRCRRCITVCRVNALFQPKNHIPVLIGDCNGCEACILVCPSDAIARNKKLVGKTFMSKNKNLKLFTGELIPGIEESSFVVNALKERVFKEAGESDIIIIDTSPGAHCNVMNALKGSDHAYAVTEPTPLGAHDLERILKLLSIMQIKANIILNRSDLPGAREKIQSVAENYNVEISGEIAMDDLLVRSYVKGIPVVRMYPGAKSSQAIIKLSQKIAAMHLS
ncbi:MAG: P-loop NTPase [Candidatus Kuenenia sp.]|nr:P-loop NTPase [Candidatus Kuenenia hertensis]